MPLCIVKEIVLASVFCLSLILMQLCFGIISFIFIDSFFGMKYNFLAGYANKRVDDLLLVLNNHVVRYYRLIGHHGTCNIFKGHVVNGEKSLFSFITGQI